MLGHAKPFTLRRKQERFAASTGPFDYMTLLTGARVKKSACGNRYKSGKFILCLRHHPSPMAKLFRASLPAASRVLEILEKLL
jgi:hypothetical protein